MCFLNRKFVFDLSNQNCLLKRQLSSWRSFSLEVHRRRERSKYAPAAALLEITKEELKNNIYRYKLSQPVTSNEIEKNIRLLLDSGLSKAYINDYIHLLSLPHLVLKNRLQICRECGCCENKIGPVILNLSQFLKIRIPLLKAYEILPNDHDILSNILQVADLPESEFNIPADECDTVQAIYKQVYELHLRREVPHVMRPTPLRINVTIKFSPSVRNFVRNVDIMKRIFKFDGDQFKKNKYLLNADPDNVLSLLKGTEGINIAELAPKYPELLNILPDKFQKIYNIAKEYNIDFSQLLRNPSVFSINHVDFEYRLVGCLNSKFLSVFKNHPRLPELIARSRIAQERLQILDHFNLRCYNLSILIGSTNVFLKHITDGFDRVKSSDDIFWYVSSELRQPIDRVKSQLTKHPFVKFIPVSTVKENLEYLRELGFDNDDIFRSIQILLYPKDTVERKIIQIHTGEVSIRKSDEEISISKRFYLPLTLYYIEKEHNFSNSALWQKYRHQEIADVTVAKESCALLTE